MRVLVLGGGYVGLYAASALEKDPFTEVTVVEPNSHMTYYPLLPEVAGGHVDPRNVAVPLVSTLRRSTVVRGHVESVTTWDREARITLLDGTQRSMAFDQVVFALGAITRAFPTPGLAENGVGFKSVEEALYLRNRVIDSVAEAADAALPEDRERFLTFVVIGGGYTGVEAMTELLDLSRAAVAAHPRLAGEQAHWHLVEALDRVAPEVGPKLSKWTLEKLRQRGITVHLGTTVTSCENHVVVLKEGARIPANTILWTAGVTPNPVLDATDAPRGPKGHVIANAFLQVTDADGVPIPGAWAAGDNAQVPDLEVEKQPAFCAPNAQHAVRQARLLAANLIASAGDRPLTEYRHKSLGTVAEYGLGRGAANIRGVQLTGLPAWLSHRAYHAATLPTPLRKFRVVAGWIVGSIGGPDLASLSATAAPRRNFERAVDVAEEAAARE
ncbi:MAG: pyridine nucleotide-disulfide oxidoreductase [Microbacteriaceae bacterium]|jgi:NADH dehydrogenase|nr:pyridine nucleotide-disulfide oxidoreductase [Microbacteriaceae bacterium]